MIAETILIADKGVGLAPRTLALLVFVVVFIFAPVAKAADLVKVCDDISPWPPFSYPSQSSSDKGSQQRTGAMVDFLELLMKDVGLSYKLLLKPWKRCLEEVKNSSGPGQLEIVVNASYNAERARNYHITEAMVRTQPGVFYSTDAFTNGLDLKARKELKKYKICGVRGYNYEEYDLAETDLFTTTSSLKKAFKMLSGGRCELIVSSIEPVLGTKLFGESIVPNNVRYDQVPGVPEPTFHMLISRGSPRGVFLLERLNRSLAKLKNDGTWDRILYRYRALMDAN